MQSKFIGFSTNGRKRPPFTLTDNELIKRDILNTFHTDRGERFMRPTYGSIIRQYLFEPFDEITKQIIISDAERIISEEPRVELINMDVTEETHGLRIDMSLRFISDYTVEQLLVRYNRNNEEQF